MRLMEAIRQVVDRHASRPAVSDARITLSYRELWEEAHLEARKLSRESPAAIIQESRSCRLVVKLLAAWLSGVPPLLLDPGTPSGRVSDVLEVLGTHQVPSGTEYLVTTSGSTGMPKIVAIGQGSLHRVISGQIESFRINSESTVGWILSPGFDASLSDIGTALCAGARLVCSSSGRPDHLDDITHLDIPPSLLSIHRPDDMPCTLKTLIVGGEPTPPETLREWARRFRVVSVYGPSEATICSSLVEVDEEWDRPYLGIPLPNVLYSVEGGELLIGGPTVGLGYVASSADSFFFDGNGVRWYRTGDLVGQGHPRFGLSFVGRKDRQVQLRGQRFEPAEVERRAASVVNRPVACEVWNGQVVLFWESGDDVYCEEDRLKQALSLTLMPAWLPQHYLGLPRMPRNGAQKIDRIALKRLADQRLQRELTSLDSLQLCLAAHREPAQTPLRKRGVKRPALLVTGATGRLGQALLPHLESRFEVWALQRKMSGPQVLQADLGQPDFGLGPEQWSFLERQMKAVLHLAASVDLKLDLASLTSLNVTPLKRLVKLGKPVYFASSLAVPLCTSDDSSVVGGYPRSKWLAEQALSKTPGLTLRYGHLIGPPRGDELLTIVLRVLAEFGCCPVSDAPRLCFDWTPLEWAAEETARLLTTEVPPRQTISIRKGRHFHLNDLADILVDGYGIRRVTPSEFATNPSPSPLASLAREALGKCLEGLTNPAFDLFLLGNSPDMLGTSSRASTGELEAYVAQTLGRDCA